MKKLLLILLLFPLISFGQNYSKGYEAGYKKGYCIDDIACLTPFVVAPSPEIGKDKYNDGYNRGVVDGNKANSSSSSSKPRGRQIVGGGIDLEAYAAASSSGNQPLVISDEAAQEVGDAIAIAITAGQISKAKKKLRKLPNQYREFPNMSTSFEIYKATSNVIILEIKPKTKEELEVAWNNIFERYNFNYELFGDEVVNIIEMYEGNWRLYKKENKDFAKSEEKKLKEYKKSLKKKKY